MGNPGAEPRLVVPEGLVIDVSARERLEHQLARAPLTIAGIAAECTELAPGASYRVHAEWATLDSTWSSQSATPDTATARPLRGAVLVRPDVAFTVRDGCVVVDGGGVLVDPGAHVHDPHRAAAPLEPASERGRPPFPRRPVVVFLACESATDTDPARRLVNRLVRREVEARLALPGGVAPDATAGLQLTRPCLADEATIQALAPDVVVTLDATAARHVDAWCEGNRATVVIAFDATLDVPMELVSWQIDHAAGRLRARIGPRVDIPALGSLIIRLCAGPHPAPPAGEPEVLLMPTRVRENWNTDALAERQVGCVVVVGTLDASGVAQVAGLVDHLEGAGIAAAVNAISDAPSAEARAARLVLLAGVGPGPQADALIDERRRAGLPTALSIEPGDVDRGSDGHPAHLTGPAAELATKCALVVASPGARFAAARHSGARVLALPTLLTRADAAELRDARADVLRESRVPTASPPPRVIGWRLGEAGADAPPYRDSAAEGLARLLGEAGGELEIVGDADAVPTPLRGYARTSIVAPRDFDAETVAGWAVHVWTPTLAGDDLFDDTRLFEEASCAGVPTVMPAAAITGVDGYVSPHVLVSSVDDAAQWYDALRHAFIDPAVRDVRGAEASRRADALDGTAISRAVVSRLMSWSSYRATA